MLTSFDKALVPIVASIFAFLNQKFGWHLDASTESLTVLFGALASIIVYFVPNKAA